MMDGFGNQVLAGTGFASNQNGGVGSCDFPGQGLQFDDGLRGAVIKLEAEQFAQIKYDAQDVTAWAGAELSKLVLKCVEKGLSGIEALTEGKLTARSLQEYLDAQDSPIKEPPLQR